MENEYKKHLKGGSLSSTFLIRNDSLYYGKNFVRKEVSLIENREYGFRRWYSQLKRLQRFSIHFPGLFPNILSYGIKENYAYFDMEYIDNSINVYDYLVSKVNKSNIEKFFNELKNKMQLMHSINMKSSKDAINLYVYEEVEQSLKACRYKFFRDFSQNKEIIFNGESVHSFVFKMNEFSSLMNKYYDDEYESYSHGNLTLENMLYVPSENKIVFIDPYEENIIDSKLADYSQILQSCNSKYEIINSCDAMIRKNKIDLQIPTNNGIDFFNDLFNNFLKSNLSENQYITVKLLEISQFIRMLPFKQDLNPNKMLVFYGLASKLLNDILNKTK